MGTDRTLSTQSNLHIVLEILSSLDVKKCINTLLFACVFLHLLKHLPSGTLSPSTSIRHQVHSLFLTHTVRITPPSSCLEAELAQ
jgi:hypothetical protein